MGMRLASGLCNMDRLIPNLTKTYGFNKSKKHL